MNESQFCGAADVGGSPSSGAVGAEDGSPFCDAVGVADESPSCGAVAGAPSCCGWCETTPTGADVVADETDRWESPSGTQQLETGNAAVGSQVFSVDKGFLHAPVASSGAPFGCVVVSASVRTHVECVRSAGERGSAECMGRPGHSGLRSLSYHGDGGGSVLVQRCLSHRCSCCFPRSARSFAAAAVDGGVVDVAAVVSSVTSPAGYPALRWTLQNLHFLLQQWLWHCGYV